MSDSDTTEPTSAEHAKQWQAWPEEILDEFGYPTADALDYIRGFYGTPAQLIEFMEELFRPGAGIKIEETFDTTWKKDRKTVSFITGGWSGCEEALGVLSDYTSFQYRFWESSHRGGLEVYEVNLDDWDTPADLGCYMPHPEAEPDDELNEGQLRFRLKRALQQARRHRRRAALANDFIIEMKEGRKNVWAKHDAAQARIRELEEQLNLS